MWHRVFGRSASPVSPAALAAHLHAAGVRCEPHFRGDDLGWTGGELRLPGGGTPVLLDRYLADEDDLRADLNAHAAELETMTYSPNSGPLMERVIGTKQLVVVRRPADHADEATLDRAVTLACQFLAAGCDGVYQADGQGWFAADGTLLVPEY